MRKDEFPIVDAYVNSVLADIKSEIEQKLSWFCFDDWGNETDTWKMIKAIAERHIGGTEHGHTT